MYKTVNTRTPYSELERLLNKVGFSIMQQPITTTSIKLHKKRDDTWEFVHNFRGKSRLVDFIVLLEPRVYRYMIDDNVHITIASPGEFETLVAFVQSTYQSEKFGIKFKLLDNMPLTPDLERYLTSLIKLTDINSVINSYNYILNEVQK